MVTADSNAESATAAAASLIKGYPEINVLVGFNEWMTLGVGNAIKQLGVKDTVRGIGFDSNVISVGMIETGEMDTLYCAEPVAIGYLGVKMRLFLLPEEASAKRRFIQPLRRSIKRTYLMRMFRRLFSDSVDYGGKNKMYVRTDTDTKI